jgi:primosomal protein N' (replication factor Y) (superfamily II helicase)
MILPEMHPGVYFADVILPLPLPRIYSYSIPPEMLSSAKEGKRAIIQFREKKQFSAVIKKIHQIPPDSENTKPLLAILDELPVVLSKQLEFWDWMSEYYMCSLGEVYKAALPSGLKLESESRIALSAGYEPNLPLTGPELVFIDFIKANPRRSLHELSLLFRNESQMVKLVNSLLERKLIEVHEDIESKINRTNEKMVRLHPDFDSMDKISNLFSRLKNAKSQIKLLGVFLRLAGINENKIDQAVKWEELSKQEGVNSALLSALVKKNIFIIEHSVRNIFYKNDENRDSKQLSNAQNLALNQIKVQFETKDTVLLHGITSSGKTEIYIQLIKECLARGEQVLYLLPEIALTTQIITRLRHVFGNKTGIYHSKFSDKDRMETWFRLLETNSDKRLQLILGARSSIFLPFQKLGLIIIDEEHENTYKQFDPAPRYHARDSAMMLARMHAAKVLLGSATPSVESFYNARAGKFGMVFLGERHQQMELPEVKVIDLVHSFKSKQMKGEFSNALLKEIDIRLQNHEQIILFQNRRGFSPYIQCHECGWVPYCKHCDVSMTYHKSLSSLRCHYCGYTRNMPSRCDSCGNTDLRTKGFGTEKIQEDLKLIFPEGRIARLDLDSARTRRAYESIIDNFEKQEIDILIGTQMISKGLDFDHVSLVGILNADNMLNFPDFRAFERSFQLMAQVSGRAGRKGKRGLVLIQTYSPKHEVIKDVVKNDFLHRMESEMEERKKYHYPPYVRMIKISLKHKRNEKVEAVTKVFYAELKKIPGIELLGPNVPSIARIRNENLREIILKIPRSETLHIIRKKIEELVDSLRQIKESSSVKIIADVDPQ